MGALTCRVQQIVQQCVQQLKRIQERSEGKSLPSIVLQMDLKMKLERVMGIEPTYSAWKAAALPLSYTRVRGSFTQA